MFDDIFNITSRNMEAFSGAVRDHFGQSIISDVFEPILDDISHLQQMEIFFQEKVLEMDNITEELKSIGNTAHG